MVRDAHRIEHLPDSARARTHRHNWRGAIRPPISPDHAAIARPDDGRCATSRGAARSRPSPPATRGDRVRRACRVTGSTALAPENAQGGWRATVYHRIAGSALCDLDRTGAHAAGIPRATPCREGARPGEYD